MARMTRMGDAEQAVRKIVARTNPGEKVGSVHSFSELTGLSTGATIEVMKTFLAEGTVSSVRGPGGGYVRTGVPMPPEDEVIDVAAELAGVAEDLAALAGRIKVLARHLPPR